MGIESTMKTVAALLLGVIAAGALAQPVRCVDPSGRVSYVDANGAPAHCKPITGSTNIVTIPPSSQKPAPQVVREATPPGVIAEAEKRLEAARAKLKEQEEIRLGGERNYARVEERLKPFQDAVKSAEEDVARLKAGR